MNIPELLKAGPFFYRITQRDTIVDQETGKRPLFGHIDYGARVIEIATKYGQRQAELSLLHEVLHALDDLFVLGLEERQVDCLAKGLYMVLDENGLIFAERKT